MLGLGSQIKPHIEKRFSMPWSHPAPRMRELILAIRAIWASWADGSRLAFRGEFYRHTLMTPMFDPGPNPFGNPPDLPGRGGPADDRGGRRGGRRAPGPRVHHRALPARGDPARARTGPGRQRTDPCRCPDLLPGHGGDRARRGRRSQSAAAARKQLAFYGSTPAYRPVLELHGWGDLQTELNTPVQAGGWDEMADLIDDEMLDTFAVVGELDDIAAEVRRGSTDWSTDSTSTPPTAWSRAVGRGAGRLQVTDRPTPRTRSRSAIRDAVRRRR